MKKRFLTVRELMVIGSKSRFSMADSFPWDSSG
jgi:hypothetical protein